MKIKCQVDDFQVRELPAIGPSSGDFALYELRKESLGTLEAVQAIARRWNIVEPQFSFAGLKDRHAATVQWLTIERGPRRNLRQSHLELVYLGQVAQPFGPDDILGNEFRITVRDLRQATATRMAAFLAQGPAAATPNYFDRQRFGSLGRSSEYVAHPWCLGDFQHALWLALAEPNEHDRPTQRDDKRALQEYWRDWPECVRRVQDARLRRIMEYLAGHPADFRRAFALIDVRIRRLHLAAFQSSVWNELLARHLRIACAPAVLQEVAVDGRPLPFLRDGDSAVVAAAQTDLPLPSARLHLAGDPRQDWIEQTVRDFGLELRQMRVKYPRDSFFSKGSRATLFVPSDVASSVAPDELYPGRHCLELQFCLPRGCYATILLKAMAAHAEVPGPSEEE